jgi:MOSC domain-containing protein YiiM
MSLVESVSTSADHVFSKTTRASIRLIAGIGVEGDNHAGATVKHRSRVRLNPAQPNLRQVHLMHSELFDELRAAGFTVRPGELGENITTRGVALLDLPTGTLLHIGREAVVELTGLRNPCVQIDNFQPGLLKAVLGRTESGELIRKSGVMSIVRVGGDVRCGDVVRAELPSSPHHPLQPV